MYKKILKSITKDGYAISRRTLEKETIESLKDELDIIISNLPNDISAKEFQKNRKLVDVAKKNEMFKALAHSPQIVGPALEYFREPVRLNTSTVWLKPAHNGEAKPPHQDAPHWHHIAPPLFFTSWLALDIASIENGCMWYLKGSHKEGLKPHTRAKDFQISNFDKKHINATAVEANAGDICYHLGETVHWTEANKTSQPRRAVSFSFFPLSSMVLNDHDCELFPLITTPKELAL